jgi:hypothetical protein
MLTAGAHSIAMVNSITPQLASFLFSSSNSDAVTNIALIASGQSFDTSSGVQLDPLSTFISAERTRDKSVALKAKEPQIAREIAAFEAGVAKATTLEELVADRKVMSVFLTAEGLGEYVDYKGLLNRALASDPADESSVARQLGGANRAWVTLTDTYDFANDGLANLQSDDAVSKIAERYAQVKWMDEMETKSPGVSYALSFKDIASTITSPFLILGNPVAREVVLTTFGIPPQIAYQSVEAQSRTIERAIDVEKLQDPKFVDVLVKRYLLTKSSSASGIVA